MEIKIREMEARDYPAMAQLVQKELGYANLRTGPFFERLDAMSSDPCHTALVAETGGVVAGFIGLHKGIAYELEEPCLRILAMAVAEGAQGHGVGSALLRHAGEYAARLGPAVLVVNSGQQRTAAHAFYEKNGFTRKSIGFTRRPDFKTHP